jgi:hypothetical protein
MPDGIHGDGQREDRRTGGHEIRVGRKDRARVPADGEEGRACRRQARDEPDPGNIDDPVSARGSNEGPRRKRDFPTGVKPFRALDIALLQDADVVAQTSDLARR